MHKKIITIIFILCIAFFNFDSSVLSKELNFAQVSDVHYSLDDKYMDKYLYFLSSSIRKKNPDFVVFLGDNVDKSREEDVIGFMRAIHSLKLPYYLVLGNNDAHQLSGLEKEIYLDIVTTFNRNQDEGKSYYYFKPNSDFICVVLDATPNFAQSKHGKISEEQIEWLDNLLTKYSKKLFIIFHHCPLLPPRLEYELSMLDTEKYESILKKHSNVVVISSGHYHQDFITEDETGIRHISAPAFKDIPHSYQLIKIIYDEDNYKTPKNVQVIVNKIKV